MPENQGSCLGSAVITQTDAMWAWGKFRRGSDNSHLQTTKIDPKGKQGPKLGLPNSHRQPNQVVGNVNLQVTSEMEAWPMRLNWRGTVLCRAPKVCQLSPRPITALRGGLDPRQGQAEG